MDSSCNDGSKHSKVCTDEVHFTAFRFYCIDLPETICYNVFDQYAESYRGLKVEKDENLYRAKITDENKMGLQFEISVHRHKESSDEEKEKLQKSENELLIQPKLDKQTYAIVFKHLKGSIKDYNEACRTFAREAIEQD